MGSGKRFTKDLCCLGVYHSIAAARVPVEKHIAALLEVLYYGFPCLFIVRIHAPARKTVDFCIDTCSVFNKAVHFIKIAEERFR